MVKLQTSFYSNTHFIISVWLLIYTLLQTHHRSLWFIALAMFFLGLLILRKAEHLHANKGKHEERWIWGLLIADTAVLASLVWVAEFPHSPWIAMILMLAIASEYGMRISIISSVIFVAIVVFRLEQLEHLFIIGALSGSVMFIALRTDQQFREMYIDPLTNLPNRAQFSKRVSHLIVDDPFRQQMFGVMLLDIQRVRRINDQFALGFENQLLVALAERLQQRSKAAKDKVWVTRDEGQRFLILLRGYDTAQQLEDASRQLIMNIQKPWNLFEHQIDLQIHGGLALYPHHGHHTSVLMEHLTRALEIAKQQRTTLFLYSEETHSSYTERYVIEAGMSDALQRGEFEIYYQPKVHIQTGVVTGIEALVRWNHPELGLLAPNKFISLAEENGLIIDLGEWVLTHACQQHAQWVNHDNSQIRMCVNVSLKQLEQPDYLTRFKNILNASGLSPVNLEIEITESTALKNMERLKDTLNQLAALGVQLTIDDFGTGYASYQHLSQLPIHALKIDKSFMRGIQHNADAEAIVSSIIQLGKSLQLRVTAEGVETFEQLLFLKKQNCDEVQGYLYLQPQPANIFETHLRRGFAHISQLFQQRI